MMIGTWIHKYLKKEEPEAFNDIEGWRTYYFDLILFLACILIPVALAVTLTTYIHEGRWGTLFFEIGIVAFLAILFFIRNPLARWGTFFFLLYTTVITFFISLGPFYARPGWLVLCTVTAALLFGAPAALASVGFNAIILLVLYFFIGPHLQSWAPAYAEPGMKWIIFVVNLSFVSLVASLPVSLLLRRLNASFTHEQELRNKLLQESELQKESNIILFNEVAERKRMEEELRASEKRHRLLAENVHDVIWIFDLNLGYTFVTPSVQQMRGYTVEEALKQGLDEILAPESYKKAKEILDREFERASGRQRHEPGWSMVTELEMNCKDGSTIWTEATMNILYNDDGEPAGIMGVTRNISERRKAEEALRKKTEEMDHFFDVNLDLFCIADTEGNFRRLNPAWERTMGYTRDELMSRRFLDFIHPDDVKSTLESLESLASQREVINFQNRYRCKDGSYRWIEWRSVPAGNLIYAAARDITEGVVAHEALLESEERFRLAFDTSPDSININRMEDGLYIDINEGFTTLTGFTREDVLGKTSVEIDIWHDPKDRKELVQGMRAKGCYENLEAEFRRKDGSLTTALMSARIIMLQGVPHILSVTRDISSRKEAEEKIRESEKKFSTAFKVCPEALTIASMKDGRYIDVNDTFLKKTGFQMDDVIGHTSTELGVWIDMNDRLKYLEELSRMGSMTNFEIQYRMRDNEVRDFLVSSEIIELAGEQCSLNFILDITDQKQAEGEMKKLASAIEQAAECVVITDPEGNITYVNPAFERITGYSKEDAIGQNTRILKSGVQDEAFYRNLWETVTRGGTWSGRFVNLRKNGTRYHEEATISPIRDKSGVIVNFVAVKKDITKEVELENQLLQSQKMEAIGQLAGGVAHDLNNLLTPILGYSEILLERLGEGEAMRGDLRQIQQAAESAKTLTRQLLAFSRKQVLEMKPVDLGKVLADFRKILRRTIREDIDIRIQADASAGYVRADIGQVEQIIMNLSVNAQDAMPKGGVLTLATGVVPPDDSYLAAHHDANRDLYVLLEVSDTGKGMDSDLIEHIFEPFFTTKDKSKGTGLGLSTVYGIVKQHNGFIDVSSEPWKGTTFRIYLPRIQDVSEIPEERRESGSVLEESGGTETILVVEDNDMVNDLACSILRKCGYTVVSARDGQECLDILTNNDEPVDLLLTDVIMPDMNGKELHDNLLLSRPGLPVIYMSGYTEDAITDHGVLAKGVDLIRKPFTRKTLINKIREVLDRQGNVRFS